MNRNQEPDPDSNIDRGVMMREYYARRAAEYETIYDRLERQGDLGLIQRKLSGSFHARRVLDIACGTGYWIPYYGGTAREVVGVDVNQPVLEVARGKGLLHTRFECADCYALPSSLGQFDAAFAGFWWSHIPKSELRAFIEALHERLNSGAHVVFLDNLYVEGSSTPILEVDTAGNSWQERTLADGTRHRVLKNFPRYDELMRCLSSRARSSHWWRLNYYWWFEYVLN